MKEPPFALVNEVTFKEGPVSNVFFSENLPESLEKKFPDGLVMKIIRDESFSVSNALGGDFQKAYYLCTATWDLKNILGHKPSAEEIVAEYKKCANETDYIFYKNELDQLGITPNELTPAHIIQLQSLLEVQSVTNAYQKRQEELAAFFADNLPHLVLKSKFSTRKTKDGKIKGFEVQPRIVDHIETSNDLSLWFFKKKCELGEFTNKQVLQIMKELQTLCTKYEQLVEEQEKVLDLSFGNLLITKEGHLLLIDTNQLFDAWEYQKSNDGQIQKVPSSPQMNMRNQIDLLKEFIEYCNGRLKTDLPSNHPSSPQSK